MSLKNFFLALISCPETKFLCPTEKKCIDKKKLCDGRKDCDDGADEKEACCEYLKLHTFSINTIFIKFKDSLIIQLFFFYPNFDVLFY